MTPTSPGRERVGGIELRFLPASSQAVPLARHALADWLQDLTPAPTTDDVVLACSELCTNAVRHTGDEGFTVRAWMDDNRVVIEVENAGDFAGAPGRRPTLSSADFESGRGLFLVEALTDSLEVDQRDGRTVVRCAKRTTLTQP